MAPCGPTVVRRAGRADEACEERAEYYDEISGEPLDPRAVQAARAEEVNFMEGWACWQRVSWDEAVRQGGRKPIQTRWVDVNKGDASSPDVRSRLVAKDFAAQKDDSFFAATPPLEALRVLLSDLASREGEGGEEVKLMVLDAKKAHLHAAAERELYVVLPAEAGGGCARLLRALYGTRDAPALWEAYAASQLTALGFRRGRANSCVYFHKQRGLRCLVHGDDFVLTGTRRHLEWVRRELSKVILLKCVGVLGSDIAGGDVGEIRVLNRVIRRLRDGVRYEPDPRHHEILTSMLPPSTSSLSAPGIRASRVVSLVHGCRNPTALPEVVCDDEEYRTEKVFALRGGIEGGHGGWGSEEEEEGRAEGLQTGTTCGQQRRRPGRREREAARGCADDDDDLAAEKAENRGCEPLGPAEVTLYRATAARANYLALDRPDLAFAAKEACRRMSAPTCGDLQALRRLCRYLLGAPRLVYHFAWQTPGAQSSVYCDTDFAGCPLTRRSTSGGCALRGAHLLKHWSVTQKAITLSSGEAELGGVVKGATEGLGIQAVARDLGIDLPLKLWADSSAAIGICRRTGIGRVRHLAVGQLWIQEKLREGQFSLYKVGGTANPADLLTKHLPYSSIGANLQAVGLQPEAGRAVSAPHVTADIQTWLRPPAKNPPKD